jgi:NADPH:quinone reductase-like Zn-dependent oxidoreductase
MDVDGRPKGPDKARDRAGRAAQRDDQERRLLGARVMFTGPYGVFENGTYGEWIAVRGEDLCPILDKIDDATAGGMP